MKIFLKTNLQTNILQVNQSLNNPTEISLQQLEQQ